MKDKMKVGTAVFAGGCFWGVEHLMKQEAGVISTSVGYAGGDTDNPSYEQVGTGATGHVEAIKVEYDADVVSYEKLAKLFFEIHDPAQVDGQGPDIGEQYMSVVFYADDEQKAIAEKLIAYLEGRGYKIATAVVKAGQFWPAEEYHQKYYEKNGKDPYCHVYVKRFE